MKYKVELLKKVNDLEFGMSKETVRDILGDCKIARHRDMFANCFAEYKESKLISIEVFGDFVVDVNGIAFHYTDDLEEATRKMLLLDPDFEIEKEAGGISRKYSLGIYFENGFEAFLIGTENYYN